MHLCAMRGLSQRASQISLGYIFCSVHSEIHTCDDAQLILPLLFNELGRLLDD